MFTESERDLLKVSRALINLHGFFIVTKNNEIIDDPLIIVNLLTKVELETFKSLLEVDPVERVIIEENVAENTFLAILGSDELINYDYTPAGVISMLAEAVIKKSEEYLTNENNLMYAETAASVNYIETMSAIIAYYMNVEYDYVLSLPICEVYKRYAVCQQAFPNQVQPLTNE